MVHSVLSWICFIQEIKSWRIYFGMKLFRIFDKNSTIDLINGSHKVNDSELISNLIVIVNNFDSDQPFLTIQRLNDLLKLNF